MSNRTFDHPAPRLYRVTQYALAALLVLMLVAIIGQIILGLSGRPGPLMFLSALVTLILVPPVLMQTVTSPPVEVSADGLRLKPLLWPEQTVPWSAVQAVKPYPLLPPSDSEFGRKLMVGRRKYKPAEGIMLVLPGLPWPYRIVSLFIGERGVPVVALTNRSHRDYDDLVRQVERYSGQVIVSL